MGTPLALPPAMTESEAAAYIDSIPTEMPEYRFADGELQDVGLNCETEVPLIKEILDSGIMAPHEIIRFLTFDNGAVSKVISHHNLLLILQRFAIAHTLDADLDEPLKYGMRNVLDAFFGLYKPYEKEFTAIPKFTTVEELDSYFALIKFIVIHHHARNYELCGFETIGSESGKTVRYISIYSDDLRQLILEKPEYLDHIVRYIEDSAAGEIRRTDDASIKELRDYIERKAIAPSLGEGVI